MNTNTIAGTAGRIAGRAWMVLQMIDWAEVARIVGHGLVALVALTYELGHLTGRAVHGLNDQLARAWSVLLVPPAQRPEPATTVPPLASPLLLELEALTVAQLRQLVGTRSKKHRKAELITMAGLAMAC